MRLVAVAVRGFRRLRSVDVKLEGRLIAIVGPNEAGKSSLLQALCRLSDDERFDAADVTRGLDRSRISIRARFSLSPEERELARGIAPQGPEPCWFVVEKTASGGRRFMLDPEPQRNLAIRSELVSTLKSSPWRKWSTEVLKRGVTVAISPKPKSIALLAALEDLVTRLDTEQQDLPSDVLVLMRGILEALTSAAASDVEERPEKIEELLARIEAAEQLERTAHPRELVIDELKSRLPLFLLFGDPERQLRNEYSASELENPPAALLNLLRLANIPVSYLKRVFAEGNHGVRVGLQEEANRTLQERFRSWWKQANVTPHLLFDEGTVRVQFSWGQYYVPIAERSDGLKAFLALCAFVHSAGPGEPPILLIDEVDSHLHYDAQADLIQMLERQSVAAQVIVSTHSAGSLPSDLGGGVRALKPVLDGGRDTGVSVVVSAWASGAGLSPLLLAMGASVLAAAPSRRAVISEGLSDVILLPCLLERATGASVTFQVAPGLAEIRREAVAELSMEAPRVAYLVDGDQGGRGVAKKLRRAGVDPKKIILLPNGRASEDYCPRDVFLEAVAEEIRLSHGITAEFDADLLPGAGRIAWLKERCTELQVQPPNRVQLAGRIRERLQATEAQLGEDCLAELASVAAAIEVALQA